MAVFIIGKEVETNEPNIEVTVKIENPLPVGKHTFQLVVVDDGNNKSLPAVVEVVVRDSVNPTAILRAPSQVEFGKPFLLDGRDSSDVPPGKVVKYIWTMLD